jgi:hypothetical protein
VMYLDVGERSSGLEARTVARWVGGQDDGAARLERVRTEKPPEPKISGFPTGNLAMWIPVVEPEARSSRLDPTRPTICSPTGLAERVLACR